MLVKNGETVDVQMVDQQSNGQEVVKRLTNGQMVDQQSTSGTVKRCLVLEARIFLDTCSPSFLQFIFHNGPCQND
jgi:hypothetical protein